MWSKFKDQLPAAIVAAVLTIGTLVGIYVWVVQPRIQEANSRQQQEIAALRASTEARIKESNDALKAQLDQTYLLLKDSVEKRHGELFMSDDELVKLNQQKVDILAKALAEKIQPYGVPIPKDPKEAEEQRNKQVDEVAGRMAGKIQPILEQMSRETSLTKESISTYGQRISDQIAMVLTAELAQKQKLNNNLLETTSIAQESMRLSQQITALYLTQMKDESLLGRILMLPARVIQDTAKGSIVNSNERQKMEAKIAEDMKRLQNRLDSVKSGMPLQAPEATTTADNRATPTRPGS